MIKVLEKSISDKIAAGEVIERPLSIVKELIENAVDAGSGSISCEIRGGGKTFIRVTDDGCGIPDGEAETAFLRHATSKIGSLADLTAIKSLGFRGEALASIAAVTRVSLITKTRESKTGTRLTIHGGELVEHVSVGCPDGTTIIVTDLFYNTPARREFLKSDAAESALIIAFLSEIALAFCHIRFQLVNNGNVVFTTAGDGDLHKAIMTVTQRREYEDLIPVDYTENGCQIRGFISRPSLSRSTRRDQIFFVNGRVISSKVMEKGLSLGYKERLFPGRYPVAYLFLQTDPGSLDVNIHPNKREVRFHDEAAIVETIRKGIVRALAQDAAIVSAGDYFREQSLSDRVFTKSSETSEPSGAVKHIPDPFLTTSGSNEESEKQVDIKKILSAKREESEETLVLRDSRPVDAAFDLKVPDLIPFDFHDLQVTGVVFDTYITAVDADHYYMIDQHAAQERIFYEKLVFEYLSDDKPSQTIMLPMLFDVSHSMAARVEEWLPPLEAMGYRIEAFGPSTYAAKEIPYFMELSEAETFLKEFLEAAESGQILQNTVVIDKLITRSCKAAIKAHDKLSPEGREQLIADLAECRNPFSCPHGRPTCIRFSLYDIEKMFKRA